MEQAMGELDGPLLAAEGGCGENHANGDDRER